jgi:hypothetical protein
MGHSSQSRGDCEATEISIYNAQIPQRSVPTERFSTVSWKIVKKCSRLTGSTPSKAQVDSADPWCQCRIQYRSSKRLAPSQEGIK